MKRISARGPEFLRILINKELEPFGVDYDFVKENPIIDGKDWFRFYTFDTKEQYEEWKGFCIEQMKSSKEKLPQEEASREFAWLGLKWGLKQTYDAD